MPRSDAEPQWSDEEFARELIRRLRRLLGTPATRGPTTAALLAETPIEFDVDDQAAALPLQLWAPGEVRDPGAVGADWRVGGLGLLQGLCGTVPSGPKEGWGLITVRMTDPPRSVLALAYTPDLPTERTEAARREDEAAEGWYDLPDLGEFGGPA